MPSMSAASLMVMLMGRNYPIALRFVQSKGVPSRAR